MGVAGVLVQPCRENVEFTCGDETCIPREQECDGSIDCSDGSDEYLQHCEELGRHIWPLAFYCTVSFYEIQYPQLCHPLCFTRPEFCLFAMMTLKEPAPDTCTLPKWPENGLYEVLEASSYSQFSLIFSCNPGFDLVGKSHVTCKDGGWRSDIPTCKPVSGWEVSEEDLRK